MRLTARRRILLVLLLVFALLQVVPYGRAHTNPPVTGSPSWDGPRTEALVRGACFDCHSNETRWPWYSHVAPFSWLVQRDVDEARSHLNFSEFDRPQPHAGDAVAMVRTGEMPLWYYEPLHAEARLSEAETAELLRGLEATFGDARAGAGGEDDGHEHEDEDED